MRADKSITNVTFGSLNSNGAFEEFAPGKKGGSTPGARIRYTDNQSGNSQTLYYFTTDISDGGIKSTPGFLEILSKRLGTGSSFLKSSSYLMFENGFGNDPQFHSRAQQPNCAGRLRNSPGLFRPKQMEPASSLAFTSARSISSNNTISPDFRSFSARQSAAARLRIRLSLELQGSQFNRGGTQMNLASIIISSGVEGSLFLSWVQGPESLEMSRLRSI